MRRYQKDKKEITILSTICSVLINSNEPHTENILKIVMQNQSFVLVKANGEIYKNESISVICEFLLGNVVYCLIRKASKITPNVVQVKADTISCKDISKDALSWVVELKEKCSKLTYLILPVLPTEGANNFVNTLRLNKEFNNVRCFFLLDKKVNFDVNSPKIKEIIRKDLYAVFLKNNSLGLYLPLPLDLMVDVKNKEPSPNASIAAKNVHFIGINVNDETLTKKKHEVGLSNVDYAGLDVKERIMGLAKMDMDSCNLLPDNILNWKIPEKWSMEDGCTIPHAYVTAYYCLIVKGYLEPGNTVLIHNGCSGIGMASICIALSKSCSVYTTVATDEQRFYIKKRFPQLKDRHILSSKDTSFEANLLMATGGEGAHVIINTLSKSLLKASVRCTAEFGRFIQLGKYDISENSTIGMSVFLKNTSFGTVVPEDIFDASIEEKQLLKKLIQEGIDDGVIKPIKREVVQHHDIRTILDSLIQYENIGKTIIKITPEMTVSYLNVNKPNQFVCNPKSSYLIYGGTSEYWTDMAEWLVFRGARKIAICSDSKPLQVHINRRLVLLRSYFGAEIIYTSKKIQTKENAVEILTEINAIDPIHAVFVLPVTSNKFSDLKSIQYLDVGLRDVSQKAMFVNLVSNAAGVTQFRLDAGFQSYNVDWKSSMEFSVVLQGLDEILTLKPKDIVIKSEMVGDLPQETVQALYKKLIQMLPTSIEDLETLHLESPQKPTFTQIQTMGPCKIREVPPIFVIPGLFDQKYVYEMVFELLHPTFVANLPTASLSLEEMTSTLVEEIRNIFPRGPYNIVGVSWGGILALEVSKRLQKYANTQITFVDGSPDTIQGAFGHLGDGPNIEMNVLSRLLNITSAETLKAMNNANSSKERIEIAIKEYQGNKEIVKNAVDVLLKRIKMALGYSPGEGTFEKDVYLIRPTGSSKYDSCGLEKYVEKPAQIFVVNESHLTMLQNEEISNTINEYVAIR